MAAIARLASRCNRQLLFTFSVKRRLKLIQPAVLISTSKKHKESAVIPQENVSSVESDQALDEKDENWISYGFSFTDRVEDNFHFKLTMFCSVTIGVMLTAFLFAYMPDYKNVDWSQREAYLVLARREAAGIPLISRDLIDPADVTLMSDEELGDTEIII